MRRPGFRTRSIALLVLLLVCSLPAVAQERSLPDLTLEELLRIEVKRVFGASERLQPVTEAPSSITIVSRAEIERYGHRTLADILRTVRGFYVTDDRNYSYLGVRGFATAGDYNTRILLLVNGRRVNDNVYDQAWIGGELGLDLAMIERVEVIRGPASALYGTNAFFGVVNIVTRTGRSVDGAVVHVEGGSLGTAMVRALAGRRLANGVDVALGGSVARATGAERLYFPAFDSPATNHGIAQGLDGERLGTLYGRVEFRDLTVTGMWGSRHKDVPTASFNTAFNVQDPSEHTEDTHGFLDASFERQAGRARVALRAAYDRASYAGRYPYEADEPTTLTILRDGFLGTRFTLDGRISVPMPGGQTLTAGGEFVDNLRQNQWLRYDDLDDEEINRSSTQHALFVQDEIRVRPWLLVNAGVRYDAYQAFNRFSPKGALIVIPSANQSFKYIYGRAFRAPNMYERYYYPAIAALSAESIGTHELIWEQYAGEWLRTSASAYWYDASDLITLVTVPTVADNPDGLGFVNAISPIDARGAALEAEVRTRRGLQVFGSYQLQRARDRATGERLTNSPRHLATAGVSFPGPSKRSSVSLDGRWLSARRTVRGAHAPAYSVANVTFTVPVRSGVELTGAIRNLFDARVVDPASDEHTQDVIEQNGRTVRVGLRWTFGRR